ncbi:MAG: ABC transporter substrate-binding protein [Rhodocyclaceae bacterium]|nr:ABC transporter substrate-binding protein [Rhodocyclaceae bacterium]
MTTKTTATLLAALSLALPFAVMPAPAFATEATAQASAPDALVKDISTQVLDTLRNSPEIRAGDSAKAAELIQTIVLPHFDFVRMTRLAVGKNWRSATPEQQQELTSLFRDLLVRTYSNALTQYRDQTLEFKPARAGSAPDIMQVPTEIVQSGAQPVAVEYVLQKQGDAWKVFDIVVMGTSLVINYRNTFEQKISQAGIDGLIQSLKNQEFKPDATGAAAK